MGSFGSVPTEASADAAGHAMHRLVRTAMKSVYKENDPCSTATVVSDDAASGESGTTGSSSTSTSIMKHPTLYYPCAAPPFLRWYVEACRAYGGATGLSDDRDSNELNGTEWFRRECEGVAATIQRSFQRKGQRRFTKHGIFYAVLINPMEQKQFAAHVKALELIQFLRIPDVFVPEAAVVHFLGVHIACIRMVHLHAPIHQASSGSSSPLSWSTRHASVAKLVVAKVIRLKNDAPLVLYESGDGRLVVVDAVTLLPELCLPGSASGLVTTPMRVEYLLGRDLATMQSVSGLLTCRSVMPPPPSTTIQSNNDAPHAQEQQPSQPVVASLLAHVIATAAGKRGKGGTTPYLHALHTLAISNTASLDDTLNVAEVPVALMPLSVYESHRPAACLENARLTSHLLQHVIPSLLEVLEALPQDMGAAEFVQLLHLAGVNVHLLGVMYLKLRGMKHLSDARQRVATEMVSRAGKRWLNERLHQTPDRFEEHTLALLRGISDASFYQKEIVPLMHDIFGSMNKKHRRTTGGHGGGQKYSTDNDDPLSPHHHDNNAGGGAMSEMDGEGKGGIDVPLCNEAPFRAVADRIQELTGVRVSQGQVKTVQPVVRMARRNFTLSAGDEASICSIAAKRTDGIAGAALFAAASWWANNPNRLARIVEQLHQRVAANAASLAHQQPQQQQPNEGHTITHLFFTELQFALGRLVLFRLHRPALIDTSNMANSTGDGNSKLHLQQQQLDADQQKRFEYVHQALINFVPSMMQLYQEASHDRLHVARQVMPMLDYLLRGVSTAAAGTEALRCVIHKGLLNDAAHHHPVASRNVADALYKLSVDACILSRQFEEAVIVAQRWSRLCPQLFGKESKQHCRAVKLLLNALVVAGGKGNRAELMATAKLQLRLCTAVFGNHVKTAAAWSECGSLMWKARPATGLLYFRRSLEMYRDVSGQLCRPVCSALYNIGLALARLNRFTSALQHIAAAKRMAMELDEQTTARMCEVSERTVYGVASLKIQRWYRELRYGQAQSQTTKTGEDVTTKCSTLSWSDEHDEIGSSVHDEMGVRHN